MKLNIIIFSTFLLGSHITAYATPQQDPKNSESIQINGQHIVIPLKHQDHWLHINEISNGKTGHVIVKSKDGIHGKIITKYFKLHPQNPGKDSYNFVSYSSTNKINQQQMTKMLQNMQHQQHMVTQFFAQQQAMMQAQIEANNRALLHMQQQFLQLQATPSQAEQAAMSHHSIKKQTWWQLLLHKFSH